LEIPTLRPGGPVVTLRCSVPHHQHDRRPAARQHVPAAPQPRRGCSLHRHREGEDIAGEEAEGGDSPVAPMGTAGSRRRLLNKRRHHDARYHHHEKATFTLHRWFRAAARNCRSLRPRFCVRGGCPGTGDSCRSICCGRQVHYVLSRNCDHNADQRVRCGHFVGRAQHCCNRLLPAIATLLFLC
jgi:hypothetical protein